MAAAEAHGKRLDNAGPARAISEDPPLTTTGLDLADLYERHVDGAFVSASKTKALHVLVQFPKELQNGDDAKTMLREARAWAKAVFGEAAIFADRVDRDEKSRHVVDLFIAPRYEKTTKHTTKTAVSTTVHLKALAEQYGRAPTLRGQGQALQDSWAEHLREKMGLDVSRGAQKRVAGDDWLSPEELAEQNRIEELREHHQKATQSLSEANSELEVIRGALEPLRPLLEAYKAFLKRQADRETPQLRHIKAAVAEFAQLVNQQTVKTLGLTGSAVLLAHPKTPRTLAGVEWSFNPVTNVSLLKELNWQQVENVDALLEENFGNFPKFEKRMMPVVDEDSGRLKWPDFIPKEITRVLSEVVLNLAKFFRSEDQTLEPLPTTLEPIKSLVDAHGSALDSVFKP